MNQEGYIKRLLNRFNIEDFNAGKTPIGLENMSIRKFDEPSKGDQKVPYGEVVGALMYLCCCTRSDIAFAISYVSRFLDSHTSEH